MKVVFVVWWIDVKWYVFGLFVVDCFGDFVEYVVVWCFVGVVGDCLVGGFDVDVDYCYRYCFEFIDVVV